MKKALVYVFCLCVLALQSFELRHTPDRLLTAYQKSVIGYFQEIALGFEYGTATPVTRKWRHDIKIFATGAPDEVHRREIDRVAAELNALIAADVRVLVVDSISDANLIVFFGDAQGFVAQFPCEARLVKGNSGLYHIFWNRKNEIVRGHIFIKTTTSEEEQRHTIREEITQAMGLGRDSDRFGDSIFRSSYTTVTEYSSIDRDIIRLLYHPSLPVGLTAGEAEAILTDILLGENSL
jgi:hypothetical protein